jgi:hypothetical protein
MNIDATVMIVFRARKGKSTLEILSSRECGESDLSNQTKAQAAAAIGRKMLSIPASVPLASEP